MNDKKRPLRSIVIGIDGGTFEIIQPLIENGRLPNISKLMSNGVHGVLRSAIPILSPSIWTTIITGKNPGKHGIYDFIRKDFNSNKINFNSSANRKAKAIWSLLSEHGKRVCIGELLMTYPPDRVNGCMVSSIVYRFTEKGDKSKNTSRTFPAKLEEEIVENIGILKKTRIKSERDEFKRNMEIVRLSIESVKYRIKMYKYLSKKENFDFRMFYFSETDFISHFTWKYMKEQDKMLGESIFHVYEIIDNYIGDLLLEEELDIVIVSDHGFRQLNRVVSLNNYLEEIGLLKYKECSILAKIERMIAGTGLSRVIGRKKYLRMLEVEELINGIDWNATKAYFFGTTTGTIYINLRGKGPHGIVDPADYHTLCAYIIHSLKNMKDPKTRCEIVDDVYKKEELFAGEYLENAPDLCVTFKEGYGVRIKKDDRFLKKEIVTDTSEWTGEHDINGIFIAAGPHFKKNSKIEEACVQDIAPTILYVMGVPIPKDMDGRILLESINTDFAMNNPPSHKEYDEVPVDGHENVNIYSEEEENKIAKRLKDLGYLD